MRSEVKRCLLIVLTLTGLMPILSAQTSSETPSLQGKDLKTLKFNPYPTELSTRVFPYSAGSVLVEVAKQPKASKIKVSVYDEEDRLITEFEDPRLCSSSLYKGWIIPVTLPGMGYYNVKVNASYPNGDYAKLEGSAAVVGPYMDESLRRKSRFGVWTVNANQHLALAAGSNWNRQMMPTMYLYPTPESIITPAKPIGMQNPKDEMFNNIGVINGRFPRWLSDVPSDVKDLPERVFYPPKDWAETENFLHSLVAAPPFRKHQTGDRFPAFFEIYNEPERQWKGTMEGLVKFHETVAKVIKSVYPEVKVYGPCWSYIEPCELDVLVKGGLLDHLDGFSIHNYTNGLPPEGKFWTDIKTLKDYMKSIGKSDMPIMISEWGWAIDGRSWAVPVSELDQARYCARSLAIMAQEKIDIAVYFELFDISIDNGFPCSFRTLRPDMSPCPAYAAFAIAAKKLGAAENEKLLQLSPELYLLNYERQNQSYAMIWDTQRNVNIKLPFQVSDGCDMMGRPLTISSNMAFKISPSPIYLTLTSRNSIAALEKNPVRITIPCEKKMEHSVIWVPEPLKASGDRLFVPENASPGNYMIVCKTGNGQEWQPLDLVSPLSIVHGEWVWRPGDNYPSIELTVKSELDRDVKVDFTSDMKTEAVSETVLSGQEKNVRIKLVSKTFPALMQKIKVNAKVAGTDLKQVSIEVPYNLLACPRIKSTAEIPSLPTINTNGCFNNKEAWEIVKSEDCSAKVRIAYDESNFYLQVVVKDDRREQNRDAQNIWRGDSIQFVLDLDTAKPIVANAAGFNNHYRVFELGTALNDKNEILKKCWQSYDPSISAESLELAMKSSIVYNNGITTYDIQLPWKAMGQEKAPAIGANIGFSLVVNDSDREDEKKYGWRHGIRLFNGIIGIKDLSKYGKLTIR